MIPGVPSMGGMELLIILAIIMLFFGAKRVPQLGRSLGQSMREFRMGAADKDEKDQAPQQLSEGAGEKPPLDGPADKGEPSYAEAERVRTERNL